MNKKFPEYILADLLPEHLQIQVEINKLHAEIIKQTEYMMLYGGMLDPKRKVKKTKLGKVLYK